MLFLFFFFTKSEEMSRVGSRDRHPRWRSKIYRHQGFVLLNFYCNKNAKFAIGMFDASLLEFLKNCIFRPAVLTGTLSWLFLVFTNFGAFIQYLAECKVTNTGTSQHCRQSPNLFD